jgi:hypothetical protein
MFRASRHFAQANVLSMVEAKSLATAAVTRPRQLFTKK